MAKKYYSLSGSNGLGVYTDLNKLFAAESYIKNRETKAFSSKEAARTHAVNRYNSLQTGFNKDCNAKAEISLPDNFTIYRKSILEWNKAGGGIYGPII